MCVSISLLKEMVNATVPENKFTKEEMSEALRLSF
jgi:hypothetical protein